MTTLMRFRYLEKSFGAKTVFSELAGEVNSGQIIGLVGENGCGKSTLLRILAGLEQADDGRIESPSPTFCTAYLPQELDESDSAVVTFVSSGHAKLWCIEQELREIEAAMAETGESVLGELLERYGRLSTDFESAGGYKLQPMAEAALLDVGLPQDLWHKPLSELSGGQKTRASLARALVKNPDLLLLDEPTNYLDFAGLAWLERWLKKSGRTVMIVSHDRYFLDKTATHIWDLKRGGLHFYKGNYSDYRRQKEQQLLEQSEAYEAHIAEKKRLREIVERQMQWFTAAHDAAGQNDFWRAKAKKLAKRAKAVASRLEQEMENSVKRPKEKNQVFVRFAAPENLGDLLVGAQELKFSYGSKEVLREVDFTLHGGERVALIGANGAGKTTLLKLLLGQLYPTAGQLQRSKVAEIGYFSQERADLDLGKTALEELLTVEGLDKATAWYLLGRLGFRGNEALKILSTCSLGERAKVSLAKLLVGKYHVLVLDEPTNHLDINSRERMEEALKAYPGALILVSHDRYFMDSVVNQVYHLENGHLTRYLGNYSYYECKVDTSPEQQVIGERKVILETRLAQIANMLAGIDKKESEQYLELEQQYQAVARELNSLR